MEPKRINYWKWGFLFVLAINLFIGLFVVQLLTKPIPIQPTQTISQMDTDSKIKTTVSLNKAEVEMLFNELMKSNAFHLSLTNTMTLTGKVSILGLSVDSQLLGIPYVTQEGNIQIKVQEIRVGDLKLPIHMILELLKHAPNFPNFLVVDSNEKLITIQLTNKEWQNGVSISATAFNIDDDCYIFDVGISNQTFWQWLHKQE